MQSRIAAALLLVAACSGGQGSTPPDATPGAAYVVKRDTPFYDGGCAQEGKPNGVLKKKTRFTLVGAADGCWNVKLASEDEVYIRPDRVVAAP